MEALVEFFGAVPQDLGLAYVVVVHLSPDHESELPAILGRQTGMPVVQVGDDDQRQLERDHVYVIAPDRKLELTDTSVGASKFDEPRGHRAAIDFFFRSLARTHGDGFAVVLSGSGTDGTVGAKAVKEAGGLVLVQHPDEAAHESMPRAVIAAGAADVVLPVRELAGRLAELARGKHRLRPLNLRLDGNDSVDALEDAALRRVLELLKNRTGHDFTKYKRNTVVRRLTRRMQLVHRTTVSDYLDYAKENAQEMRELFDDLLINVTTFFRDPEAWAALQTQFIARLVERAGSDEQIRVWVPGCATGEEAFTLAILFQEEFDRRGLQGNLVIFASDVDEGALAVAREGLFSSAIASDVSESRLERYFTTEDDHYRINRELRDRVVFAAHSLLRDPPFSRLHLVSCRNLLIYLDREVQDQVMAVFRYASREDGLLFLGASETASAEIFAPVDKKNRIFEIQRAIDGSRPPLPDLLALPTGPRRGLELETRAPSRQPVGEAHVEALEEAAPPSVLVDERWNVLHVSAHAARFFEQSAGPLARKVTELVRQELRDELHAILFRAFESPEPHLSPFLAVRLEAGRRRVAVLAQRRTPKPGVRAQALITFLDGGAGDGTLPTMGEEPTTDLIFSLREQLRQTERRADRIRDDHHLTNEDLRAANEELQSLNEEYRSTTEELETSKEELQSINEELQTVNHELKTKLEEASRARSDIENLMGATDVAILFLDPDLCVKRFTPRLSQIFNIKARDLDRPIGDVTHSLDYGALEEDARTVLSGTPSIEREANSRDGRAFIVRLHPYRMSGGDRTGGVVVTFIDVTDLKRMNASVRESEQKLRKHADDLAAQARNKEEFLAVLGHELRNPLAAVVNGLELSRPGEPMTAARLTILRRQSQHLIRLVNDLLDVTRINHGKVRLERRIIDACEYAREASESLAPAMQKKGIQLVLDTAREPLLVDADPARLAQILDNLLRNAVAYTDTGRITVSLREEGSLLRVVVTDTGLGIEPNDASALFEPFTQVDHGKRAGGLGLGLALVKRLVELHGGTVSVTSAGRGAGSTFSFTVPLARATPSNSPPVTPAALPRRRILVVDDEADNADMFATVLEILGQDAFVAYNSTDALKMARERRPEIAFLDLSMPEVGGRELARRLRLEFPPDALTLIALTGFAKDHPDVRDSHFTQHLLKPATVDGVAAMLQSLATPDDSIPAAGR